MTDLAVSGSAPPLVLHDAAGRAIGTLDIGVLPTAPAGPLQILDLRDANYLGVAAPFQLLEEARYEYNIVSNSGAAVIAVEPLEVFSPGRIRSTGRVEPKRWTGTIGVRVAFADGSVGECEFEVRSRKLGYETEYRNMLLGIADQTAELTQSMFSASSLAAFQPNPSADPATTYQRFAFIRSVICSADLLAALELVMRQPHQDHSVVEEIVPPSRGVRARAGLIRELTRAGGREPVEPAVHGHSHLPRYVRSHAHRISFDTVPNRFVKYVLERWKSIAIDVDRSLQGTSASTMRGRRETAEVLDTIDQFLAAPPMREAGRLTAFPSSNQVLQGRSGYREVTDAFLRTEAAASISWDGGADLLRAGQRNAAELYEYWTFLEIVRVIKRLDLNVTNQSLLSLGADGMQLDLKRGGSEVLVAQGTRAGVVVTVEVWFNHRFPRAGSETWSVAMHPDCSIRIQPDGGLSELDAATWLHFDAKYKVDSVNNAVLDAEDNPALPGEPDVTRRPVSSDLMKMHAYRDAVRRSVGSYVLYPGDATSGPLHFRQHIGFDEIVPGIGAFSLRPGADGHAPHASSEALRVFLDEVIDYVAAQGTRLERERYWSRRSHNEAGAKLERRSLLTKPPADTSVLVGYVKSEAHLDWILRARQYNLRANPERRGAVAADSPTLSADFLLLYGPTIPVPQVYGLRGEVLIRTQAELQATNYPDPGGTHYFCVALEDAAAVHQFALADADLNRIIAATQPEHVKYAPAAVSWLAIADAQALPPSTREPASDQPG